MTGTITTDMDKPPRWWRTARLWWVIGIAAVLILLAGFFIEHAGKPAPMPYSTLMDQLDAGNVASVTFKETEIAGSFKQPVDATVPTGTARRDTFISRVPDIGDPSLILELRRQHIAIDVSVPSAWTWLLGRIPFPILIFLGIMIVGGFVRLVAGRKRTSGSAVPMPGMAGLLAGLFGRQRQMERRTTDRVGELNDQ
jgi:ATP-dependent Zn protease